MVMLLINKSCGIKDGSKVQAAVDPVMSATIAYSMCCFSSLLFANSKWIRTNNTAATSCLLPLVHEPF